MDGIQYARERLKADAAMECNKAIDAAYDVYARENIGELRKNLDTGSAYTQTDLDTMNTLIDAKRQKYKDYKDDIDAATTEQELIDIVLDYT